MMTNPLQGPLFQWFLLRIIASLGSVSGQNTESEETGKETGKESNAEKVKDLMRSNKRITIKEMTHAEVKSEEGKKHSRNSSGRG